MKSAENHLQEANLNKPKRRQRENSGEGKPETSLQHQAKYQCLDTGGDQSSGASEPEGRLIRKCFFFFCGVLQLAAEFKLSCNCHTLANALSPLPCSVGVGKFRKQSFASRDEAIPSGVPCTVHCLDWLRTIPYPYFMRTG